jgi:hypothetical protein
VFQHVLKCIRENILRVLSLLLFAELNPAWCEDILLKKTFSRVNWKIERSWKIDLQSRLLIVIMCGVIILVILSIFKDHLVLLLKIFSVNIIGFLTLLFFYSLSFSFPFRAATYIPGSNMIVYSLLSIVSWPKEIPLSSAYCSEKWTA